MPTLDVLLDEVHVAAPDEWENDDGPKGWWAVATSDRIIAYFCNEQDAFRFRLDLINLALNARAVL